MVFDDVQEYSMLTPGDVFEWCEEPGRYYMKLSPGYGCLNEPHLHWNDNNGDERRMVRTYPRPGWR